MKNLVKKGQSGLSTAQRYLTLFVLGIDMGILEAIVVIYIRQLYYPWGFTFPLKWMPSNFAFFEWIREAATIVMLISVGILTGKNNIQRLCYFLFSFGIWDIVYYVALKAFIQWPITIFDWDILFLIPITWIGPVLAPVICSVTMILGALGIVYLEDSGYSLIIKIQHCILGILGAFVIFCTFVWDYTKILYQNQLFSNFFNPDQNEKFIKIFTNYQPEYYHWIIFILGEILILIALIDILRKSFFKGGKTKK
jgi:hypothetical protein